MNQRKAIDAILAGGSIAIAGVSRKKEKFGSALFKELKEKGMDVVGVHPSMTDIMGSPCYPDVESLPEGITSLVTVVKPHLTASLVRAAEKKGIRNIWMQQGSQSDEAIRFCQDNGMNYVAKACVLMYAEPVVTIHKFHRGLAKLFGTYQRD